MRIGIAGAPVVGKTTFVKDFLKKWPNYKPYFLEDNFYKHYKEYSNVEDIKRYLDILQESVENAARHKQDYTIFDTTHLDYLALLYYLIFKNVNGSDKENLIKQQTLIVRESLKFYDILFYIPSTTVAVKNIDHKETIKLRTEINNLFKVFAQSYYNHQPLIFPPEGDCPAFIELFGSPEERIMMASLYINEKGDAYGEEESLIQLPEGFEEYQTKESIPLRDSAE